MQALYITCYMPVLFCCVLDSVLAVSFVHITRHACSLLNDKEEEGPTCANTMPGMHFLIFDITSAMLLVHTYKLLGHTILPQILQREA